MQTQKANWVQYLILIGVIVLVVVSLLVWMQPKEEPVTAEDIASKIVFPEIPEIPEIPDTYLSLREKLKSEVLDLCGKEFNMDEVEDLFDDDDEIVLVKEYTEDRLFWGVNLGIDNPENRRMTVRRVYKVEVTPDLDDEYRDKVYVRCDATTDDGELEAELDYWR